MKVNADKCKVMVFSGKKELKCDVCMDGIGCDWSMCQNLNTLAVFCESGTNEVECRRMAVIERKVGGAIRVFQEAFLVSFLVHGSKTMICKEK